MGGKNGKASFHINKDPFTSSNIPINDEFKDYYYHGKGILNSAKISLGSQTFGGHHYEGEFADGSYNGQGILNSPDGSTYVGEFNGGRYNGQGTLTSPNGDKTVGEFKDDKIWNGKGIEIYHLGGVEKPDKYEGEFKNGQWNGQGIFINYMGGKKEGKFNDGKLNGQGKETHHNEIYEGEFKLLG